MLSFLSNPTSVGLFTRITTILVVKECTIRFFFFIFSWQVDGLLAGNIPKL